MTSTTSPLKKCPSLFPPTSSWGEAFEDRDDEAMFGLGFHMEDPLALIRYKADQADQARRELIAAIKLARYKGQDWTEIGPPYWA